jgi:hypothetical protein
MMPDEILPSSIALEAVATQDEPKKKRAPRRSKEEIAAALAAKKSAKSGGKATPKSRGGSKLAEANPANKASATVPKGAGASSNKAMAFVHSSTDGFADLVALEEENLKLRKSLAEKLRQENADLRKKLGLV